ncbi:MAG TPA: DUF4886 domain-containing protein [Edaphocola sp.]|nr:DUF4886 domain-containing protein [Edaphocola sp.]
MRVRFLFLSILIFSFNQSYAKKVKALFIGNSYTFVNNLPDLIQQMAIASGDTLEYGNNTPGGYTLQQHSNDANTKNLIQAGNWDFVILQEQSQLPSFPDPQVQIDVYPYAKKLDSMIKASNPCATTLFYMTWGRKNGDAQNCPSFPPLCTYEGMDSLLQLRYTIMAEQNNAAIAPVAVVWRALRTNNPGIELYSQDESHPDINGSYAAACTFYSVLFQKSPIGNSFHSTVSTANAQIIQNTSSNLVFDSLSTWNRFLIVPKAKFTSNTVEDTVNFNNLSENASEYLWDFGDGNQDTVTQPSHIYTNSGTYTVTLIAKDSPCEKIDTFTQTITITTSSKIKDLNFKNDFKIYPNPANQYIKINSQHQILGYEIINILGKAVFFSSNLKPSLETNIDISNLTSGLYLLKLHYKNSISTEKFIKQ